MNTNLKTLVREVAAFLEEARSESGWHNFDGMPDRQRKEIAEQVKERFGVHLRWRVVEGDPRKGQPENRLKPPRVVGHYSTVRYGWLDFFEIYEGQVGDPVLDEEGEIAGVCVRSKLSWGDPQIPGWQSVAWIVPLPASPLTAPSGAASESELGEVVEF